MKKGSARDAARATYRLLLFHGRCAVDHLELFVVVCGTSINRRRRAAQLLNQQGVAGFALFRRIIEFPDAVLAVFRIAFEALTERITVPGTRTLYRSLCAVATLTGGSNIGASTSSAGILDEISVLALLLRRVGRTRKKNR